MVDLSVAGTCVLAVALPDLVSATGEWGGDVITAAFVQKQKQKNKQNKQTKQTNMIVCISL